MSHEKILPENQASINIRIKACVILKIPNLKLIKNLHLNNVAFTFMTYTFNAILRTLKFPRQRKVAEIHMILKPGKPAELSESYRKISLLPVLSKILKTLLLKRLCRIIICSKLIPEHYFGSTTLQLNKLIALEDAQFCTAVVLDISQTFDKVWHPGLLHKLKHFFAV